jgi:glycosyltransferase involved in cell wall biosynthesis
MGGAVSYLTSLLQHLPPPNSGNRFFVFVPDDTVKLLPDVPGNIRLCALRGKETGGWRRLWWEQVTLRRFLRQEKVDFLFSTANFAMFRCPVRQVLLVRNALYFSKMCEQMFLRKHALRYRLAFAIRRWMILESVRSADVVMTPTQAMLDDLRQFAELDPKKLLVNPYGVATADFSLPGAQRVTPEPVPAAQRSVRLIYVSLYSEHKNLTTLLKALPLLNRNGAVKFVLRTTVDPGWEGAAWTVTHKADSELARRPGVAPWVEFLGPLTKGQVQQLYRDADLFVFPSFCESFGHPLAEAMAHGLPVVASDTPVNREMCGEAAIYFSPLDPEDLARQIRRVASDPALGQRLRITVQEEARTKFRWDAHVRKILAAGCLPFSRGILGRFDLPPEGPAS